MHILREVVDFAKHLVWAVLMGVLIEFFNLFLPMWVSVFLALAVVVLFAWAAWRWIDWTVWRQKK